VKFVARVRTPDGNVLRLGLEPQPAGAAVVSVIPPRLTPPPLDLFARPVGQADKRTEERGAWWILKALRESYQRFF
jgi:hypothetical protein